ncbi:MAG: protein phosphatase 2C domain-containing protein [Anaerolineae bacterium]|nr:protein phosphatase 2C domain-containing protein [Anaerolineae bacterium]
MGKAPQRSANGWRVVGRSVQGASHARGGMPNQDAIQWFPDSGEGPPLILSVSDGHGSPRNFRSDVGAQFAVEAATSLMRELLLAGQPDPSKLSTIKRTAEERLPSEVVRRWRAAVTRHLDEHPITQEELETLEKRRDAKARRSIERDPQVAYGATLLSVLITSGFVLYMQLGDGDILTVADNGEVTRPMTRDPRLMANETTSLCMHDAWREVQIKFQALYGPHPALILLSTDGYANSFVNEEAFRKVGSDILDILRTDGLEIVELSLSDWLKDASQAGSGDDITMGIVFPVAILAASASEPPPVVAQPPKPHRKRTTPRKVTAPSAVPRSTTSPEKISQPVPDQAKPSAPSVEAEPPKKTAPPEETAPPEKKPKAVKKDKAEVQEQAAVPPAAAEPESVPSTESASSDAEAIPAAPPEEKPAEPPAKPRIELIKNEDRPREPSKKLPDIFYDD